MPQISVETDSPTDCTTDEAHEADLAGLGSDERPERFPCGSYLVAAGHRGIYATRNHHDRTAEQGRNHTVYAQPKKRRASDYGCRQKLPLQDCTEWPARQRSQKVPREPDDCT